MWPKCQTRDQCRRWSLSDAEKVGFDPGHLAWEKWPQWHACPRGRKALDRLGVQRPRALAHSAGRTRLRRPYPKAKQGRTARAQEQGPGRNALGHRETMITRCRERRENTTCRAGLLRIGIVLPLGDPSFQRPGERRAVKPQGPPTLWTRGRLAGQGLLLERLVACGAGTRINPADILFAEQEA
jgi:hypothetical protein